MKGMGVPVPTTNLGQFRCSLLARAVANLFALLPVVACVQDAVLKESANDTIVDLPGLRP